MHDRDLRVLWPTRIVHGALLRPDGGAVGFVSGGAPAWDLRAQEARGQLGADYHRLLMARDQPLDVYVIDLPLDLADDLAILHARQAQTTHPVLAAVLEACATTLRDRAEHFSTRTRQVIWTVTVTPGLAHTGTTSLLSRLWTRSTVTTMTASEHAVLAQAVDQARHLVDALTQLGGQPPAQLMDAEAIARLLYQLADPIRASRYPLAGPLLDRVRRVILPGGRYESA